MWVEYQRFGWKEYVSLKRYYNLLCKCKTLEKENKNLKEMCGKLWEMNGKLWERVNNLEEENKKLKEEIRFLEECLDRKEKLNEGYREEIDLLKKWNLPSPWYPYGWWPIFC